jgi:predicted lipoprotein with Yx(FWY)xxD motif
MKKRIGIVLGAAAVTLLALAGCSSGGTGTVYGGSPSPSSSAPSAPSASGTTLKTANTSLGTVLVDDKGLTVYVYDMDTANSGKSACTGACIGQWPAVAAGSATPKVDGVTGKVGTITGTDGKPQVTVDGLPLYTFAGDSSAGDVTGQGFDGIWWVVGADGKKITSNAPSGMGTGTGTGSGGYSN